MRHNYNKLEKIIGDKISVYDEGEIIHVFQLTENDMLKGSIILEERDDKVVIWSNDIIEVNYIDIYEELINIVNCDLIITDIDNEDDYLEIVEIGGKNIEFIENEYNSKFGTLLLKKNK